MSLFRTLDKATHPHTKTIAYIPSWSFLCPALFDRPIESPRRRRLPLFGLRDQRQSHREKNLKTTTPNTHDAFVDTLVQLGRCRRQSGPRSSKSLAPATFSRDARPVSSRTQRNATTIPTSRSIHTTTAKEGQAAEATAEDYAARSIDDWMWEVNALPESGKRQQSPEYKEEMKEIVNVYGEWDSTETIAEEPGKAIQLDMPETRKTDNHAFLDGGTAEDALDTLLPKLRKTLQGHPKNICVREAMSLYSKLPQPRASHLWHKEIHKLLKALSWAKSDRQSRHSHIEEKAQQYLGILDDMKIAKIPIKEAEWNSAIWYAGQCITGFSRESVEEALALWREMEATSGIKGNIVTLTILFDRATKAGKYVLADMIYKEMINRELVVDRFARLARIYYHGKRGDGEAVRFSYARFVDSGEIVTTSALNCVLDSLLNAGEPAAAEQVFENMKHHHDRTPGSTQSPEDPREERALHRIVANAAKNWRDNPEARQSIQAAAPIGPSTRTYISLIRYYARDQGDLERVWELLNEMEARGLQADWSLYIWIFKAFEQHGGVRFSAWTEARLEFVWTKFIVAAEANPHMFEKAGVKDYLVCAFVRCCGIERTEEVFQEWKRRWKPDDHVVSRARHRIQKMYLHAT